MIDVNGQIDGNGRDEEFWRWVNDNLSAGPEALRLKFHGRQPGNFDVEAAIRQVECRRRYGKKLAQTLAENPRFFFPTLLSGEQCTSDLLADYHASLVPEGSRLIDLTAGLGIDAIHCFGRCREVAALERDPAVAAALAINAAGIEVVNADCREFVRVYQGEPFDVAFIDPARRSADGGRVYGIADCEPDVLAMLPDIRRIARRLIIKLSPMLDVASTLAALPETKTLTALGTTTECKELLVEIDFGHVPGQPEIRAVTMGCGAFSFTPEEKAVAQGTYAEPREGMWLYEPYPAAMKTGAFALLSERYGVAALGPNTHVFISEDEVKDFPGVARRIEEVVPFASKFIKRLAARYPRIDVAARNFPLTAETLARKLKVKQGGGYRLIAVTTATATPLMLIAR